MTILPPIGVMPHWLWIEFIPDPTLADLLERYTEVAAACDRYREAGLTPNPRWRRELGLDLLLEPPS